MAGFELRFVAMGMGDCTMIKCPDGKVIIVDCGTSSEGGYNDPEVHIKTARHWLSKNAKSGKVHAAVLTHADKDHYNRFVDILFSKEAIDDNENVVNEYLTLENVYFSCPAGSINTHPLALYKENNVGGCIAGQLFSTTGIFMINLHDKDGNKNEVISYTWTKNGKKFIFSSASTKISGTPGKHTIIKSTENNNDWSVDILAGNVGEALDLKSEQKRKNANSLVVLLTYGGKKVMLMGDADHYTQNYLLESATIKAHDKLELMTAPHHGSRENFTWKFFGAIQTLDTMIISSEYLEHKHSLPNYKNAMDQWEEKVNKSLKLHDTYYWDIVDYGDEDDLLELKKKWNDFDLDENINPHKLNFSNENTVGRWEPDNEGRTIIRKQTGQVNLMTEYQIKKNILQTSTGSMLVGLNEKGIKMIKHPWDQEPNTDSDILDE